MIRYMKPIALIALLMASTGSYSGDWVRSSNYTLHHLLVRIAEGEARTAGTYAIENSSGDYTLVTNIVYDRTLFRCLEKFSSDGSQKSSKCMESQQARN